MHQIRPPIAFSGWRIRLENAIKYFETTQVHIKIKLCTKVQCNKIASGYNPTFLHMIFLQFSYFDLQKFSFIYYFT